jgi:tetratricopeptide (TPR) repeat protein
LFDTLNNLADFVFQSNPDLILDKIEQGINVIGGSGEAKFLGNIGFVNKVIGYHPNYYRGYAVRCYLYSGIQKFQEAARDCNRAIQLNPNAPKAWNFQGLMFSIQGKGDQAVASFTRAIELGDAISYIYNRGYANLHLRNQRNLAIQDFNRILERNPNHANALYDRALAYKSLGEYQKAINDFEALMGRELSSSYRQKIVQELRSLYQTLGIPIPPTSNIADPNS